MLALLKIRAKEKAFQRWGSATRRSCELRTYTNNSICTGESERACWRLSFNYGCLFCSRNLLSRGACAGLLPETAGLRGLPDDQEGVTSGVQGRLRWGTVLRAPAEQEEEILFRMHGRLLLCGRAGEGGQVRLRDVCVLMAPGWLCLRQRLYTFLAMLDSLMPHSGNIWNIL